MLTCMRGFGIAQRGMLVQRVHQSNVYHGREPVLPLHGNNYVPSALPCPSFLSNTNNASSLAAKLGSGICSTFSHSDISLAIHSAIVSSAKPVKPEAFCEPAETIVVPPDNPTGSASRDEQARRSDTYNKP